MGCWHHMKQVQLQVGVTGIVTPLWCASGGLAMNGCHGWGVLNCPDCVDESGVVAARVLHCDQL